MSWSHLPGETAHRCQNPLQDSAAISALQVSPVPKNPDTALTVISMTTSHAVIFSRVSQEGKQTRTHTSSLKGSGRMDWINTDGLWVDIPPQSLQKEGRCHCHPPNRNTDQQLRKHTCSCSGKIWLTSPRPVCVSWTFWPGIWSLGAILSHNLPSAAMGLLKVGILT